VDAPWGDKAGLDRPRQPAPTGKAGVKSTPIAAADIARNGKRALRVRYGPVNSTTGLFGNVLETISAHWPPVLGHIHYFLPRAV
jgi:hypothetical protein